MLSSACRYEEHGLCHVKGRIRMPDGKKIRCKCGCHVSIESRRERKWRKRKEAEAKIRAEEEL